MDGITGLPVLTCSQLEVEKPTTVITYGIIESILFTYTG